MAAASSSPSGFSYAQAAKGQASMATSQAPSSKVTSGTATPATGTFSDLASSSNWADDVEAHVGDKTDSRKPVSDQATAPPAKESAAVERTKSESRIANGSSGVSSPDLAATPSTATNTDESSSAPNTTTSSDTTWETKSQNSAQNFEPAWIAERKERQHHDKVDKVEERPARRNGKKGEKSDKTDKDAKEPVAPKPEPKPVVLTESAPPAVNPWAKRMEESKIKSPVTPQTTKPASPASPLSTAKESQQIKADTRKKANSIAGIARDAEASPARESKKTNGTQGKRALVRDHVRQGSKRSTENARPESSAPTQPRAVQREAHSLPNLAAAPPLVKDETSWPTPDKVEKADDKDRQEVAGVKPADPNGDAEADGGKPREKTKWQHFAVTPSIVWETEEMNRPRGSGDRGGRGGASTRGRGRGDFRGVANGGKGGDRAVSRKDGSPNEGDNANAKSQRGSSDTATDREAMPPSSKPSRQPTASGSREASQARGSGQGKATTLPSSDATASKNVTATLPTDSPAKMEAATSHEQEIKEPITGPFTAVTPTNDSRDGSIAPREVTGKRANADGKKDVRNTENFSGKDSSFPRGGKRGGRGRGGSREFNSNHQASQAFVNGHGEIPGAYGVPPSPAVFPSPRGAFSSGPGGRGGWRGNPRSQSIPIDNVYQGRFGYGGSSQLPPVHTYYPGMTYSDYNGMPVTAVPFHPMMEHQYLIEMVKTQLDYYFSVDNLLKDMFLRKNMDSQGFVFLDIVANFNRIKQLSPERELTKAACMRSEEIEILVGDDGKERLRRSHGWEQFLLPMEQREPSVQNDGPQSLRRPEQPQLQFYGPPPAFRGPASAGLPGSQGRRSYDAAYAMNGATPQFAPFSPLHETPYGEALNGEEGRGRAAKSPVRENGDGPIHQSLSAIAGSAEIEPDVFPDEHASTLTVVVKLNPPKPQHAASRTFSNGSIDTRSIFTEMEKPTEEGAKPPTTPEPLANGDHSTPSVSRHASPSTARSPEKNTGSELTLLWVKDKEVPQDSLPQNATLEPYVHLRIKALTQRDEAATGTCPYDLDVLYQFWSHFLIRNFNNKMYSEFKYFANDDAQVRHNGTGMQNLVQFYAKALSSSNPIRDHIVKDYVQLVRSEPAILQGAGFANLRKAWRNGALNLKNRKKLTDIVDEELKKRLDQA